MLSSGTYHRDVPREPLDNLKFRRHVLTKCRASRRYRTAVLKACKTDLLFYVNTFVWQFNPRKKGEDSKIGPFITWEFQERAMCYGTADVTDPETGEITRGQPGMLKAIEEDRDLVIQKSREMGASWMSLIVMEWLWHFHPWQKFLMISRSEAAVEADDPDSLFWKLDFILRYMPDWLLDGYDPRKHRRGLFFSHPKTQSTITGQASTGRAGVGGRATAMFIDEFSQIKEDYEVLDRTADTTGCRIFNGTHLGTGTALYDLTHKRVDWRRHVLELHWTQHPEKRRGLYRYNEVTNKIEVMDPTYEYPPDFVFDKTGKPNGGPFPGLRSPWYDDRVLRSASDRAVAMDLDINPQGSVSQFFDAATVRMMRLRCARPPLWEGELEYERDTGRFTGLTSRAGGWLKLWCPLQGNGLPLPRPYAIGGDPAAGTGATPSCLSVLDANTMEQVAAYTNPHIEPKLLAPLAVALCWLFKDVDARGALFAWEMQGPGVPFGRTVVELGYRRIYYRLQEQKLRQLTEADTPGWYPSVDGKRVLLEDFRQGVQGGELTIRDDTVFDECLQYKYTPRGTIEHDQLENTNDPSGARMNHGDRVVATALAYKMARTIGRTVEQEHEDSPPPGSLAHRRLMAENSRVLDPWA